jgi:hypothetical protein
MVMRPIIFDFINKIVVHVGSDSDADKRYQEFIAQQQRQTATSGRPPA